MSISGTLAATVKTNMASSLVNNLALTAPHDDLAIGSQNTYSNGTGVGSVSVHGASVTGTGKARIQWESRRTLTTGTNETLTLSALASPNAGAFGTTVFTKIKEILIQVEEGTTGYILNVGAAASNPWAALAGTTGIIPITAGGKIHVSAPVDGLAVSSGTSDQLKFANPSGGTVHFQIIIIGEGTMG